MVWDLSCVSYIIVTRNTADHRDASLGCKRCELTCEQVYRNRDASAARRGLKKLEKHWEDDGETLRRVQDGSLT